MRNLFVILCLVGLAIANNQQDDHPEVDAPIGRIRGSIIPSRLGKQIYSFRGVRYAEAPVGQQRFQPPIPAADLQDVFDASEEGPSCPGLGEPVLMSEDCLCLNVYTTRLPSKTKGGEVRRPVIVFFHPGGFYSFSGQSRFWGPQYMLDKDVVLVTVNYRLGTLGFLSTGDSLAPGNLGFKDQVIALRWIQRNIAAFGGDPNCVTISGYSAGGFSVLYHMISPMSKGLFHRAIAMSGTTTKEPLPTDQKDLARRQAELLGCPTDTTGAMLVCFNSKPVENFTNTMSQLFEWYGDPILEWSPVVEPEVHGVERFMPAQPYDLIRQGKIAQVPLIMGVTRDEFGGIAGLFAARHNQGDDSVFQELNANWYRIAPISYIYERNTDRSRHISDEIKRFYFNNQPVSPDTYDGIAHVYADSVITYAVHRAAQEIANNTRIPLYFYMFTFEGRYTFTKWNETTNYGVVHHDDLQYLFFISALFPFFEANAPEIPMVEKMTSMWTNFAKTGEPIPQNDPAFHGVTWDRYSSAKDNFLDINLNPVMRHGLYPERMQFWDSLYPVTPASHHHHHHNHHTKH